MDCLDPAIRQAVLDVPGVADLVNLPKNDGKSPFSMGNSTISMVIFNSKL